MFKLGRPLSIACWRCPLVFPSEILPSSLVYHGLNCENVARLHKPDCFVVPVMRYLGSAMENISNSMSSITSNNWESLGLHNIRNYITYFSIHSVWLAILNRFHQWFICSFYKQLRRFAHLTNVVGLIQVPMITVFEHRDINIDNITFFQRPCVWNAVADDFIDTRTARPGKAVIVQWGRIRVLTYNKVVDCFVDFLGGHPRFGHRMSQI